jgi:hypothetical protein
MYSNRPPTKAPKRLLANAILGNSTTAKALAKISAAKKIGNAKTILDIKT